MSARRWLRTNLLALLVLATAIPALAFVLVGLPIINNAESAPRFVPVAQGEAVESNGYTLTLTLSDEFVGTGSGKEGNHIPIGSSLVAAVIDIEPTDGASTDDALVCGTELTSFAGGQERSWAEVDNPAEFKYQVGDGRTSFCTLEGEPTELEVVYLTPTGVYDDAVLDLTLKGDSFRFALAH
jgi:hypothetical protein